MNTRFLLRLIEDLKSVIWEVNLNDFLRFLGSLTPQK
jgi:hypothetical protein